MSVKLLFGQAIESTIDKVIELNYKLIPFIPNGRIVTLDLKRAKILPKVIFDVGANIGQTAVFFNKNFPGAKIYCFEPVHDTYNELLENTKDPQIKCFNKALGDTTGESIIYKNDAYSGVSSLVANEGFSQTETINVDTGINICNEQQINFIDILKIDTEGYELQVLKGFEPMLQNQVKFIYVEVGFDKKDESKTYLPDLLAYLAPYGFISSAFYNPYRVGKNKFKLNHYDLLLSNTALVDV